MRMIFVWILPGILLLISIFRFNIKYFRLQDVFYIVKFRDESHIYLRCLVIIIKIMPVMFAQGIELSSFKSMPCVFIVEFL